jgi:acetolactate synthase-1/2/3 large subunit
VTEPRALRPALDRAFASGRVACVNVILDPEAYRATGQVSMAI